METKFTGKYNINIEEQNWQSHDAHPNLLLINILSHQCLRALHFSIVPLFSCGSPRHDWVLMRSTSVQAAYEHVNRISELIGWHSKYAGM